MPARLYLLGPRARALLAGSALLLAAVEIYVDWDTWIQLNVSIVYSLPLVVAAAARNRRLIWLLLLLLLTSTFVVYALQIPPGDFTLREPFFVNRVLASVTLLLSASLLHVLTLATDALDARGLDAEEASTRKSRLLASVSHDMRTPLTTINVMAELIRHSADDPALAAQLPGLARSLQTSALSMSDMVGDVLDISAIDSGRVGVHANEFILGELLAQELQGFEPLARAKGLRLQLEQPARPMHLRTDRVKLGRVVRNLVMNAIKFTDAGSITLGSEITGDGAALIFVADTGVGIAQENLDRIFGEFAQLRAASAENKRGWGLGLAVSKRLVGMMGGLISVESTVNVGSKFTVRLPPACVIS